MGIKANPECLSGYELWSVTIVFRARNSFSTEIKLAELLKIQVSLLPVVLYSVH
jgi:hypothetical protein